MDLPDNPKVAAVVAASSAGAGVGSYLDYMGDILGIVASVSGLVLSSVLIYNHIKMGILERKKTKLEIKRLEK